MAAEVTVTLEDLAAPDGTLGDATPEVPLVALAGEVDVHTAPTVRAELLPLAERAAATGSAMVVDLDGVGFLDSTGLGVIVGAQRVAGEGTLGGTLHLVCAQPRLLRLLHVTGVDDLVVVHADRAAAKVSLGLTAR